MKNFYGSMKNKAAVAGGLVAGALLLAENANAAIDASVGTALTAVQADAVSLSALFTPVVIAVLGLFIVMKLIKRFGSKI